MSTEMDDEVWEPEINTITEEHRVAIDINTISQQDVISIENAAKRILAQKMAKLAIIFDNLTVYAGDEALIINDRFGICRELPEILLAFGMSVQSVDCNKKGKTYLVSDGLYDVIRTTDASYSMCEYANTEADDTIDTIFGSKKKITQNANLSFMLQTLRNEGRLSIDGTEIIKKTYTDGVETESESLGVKSNKQEVEIVLRNYLNNAGMYLEKANENMRDGLAKLIFYRARQMGYSVQEEKKGEKVQLVLVRLEG